MERNAAPASEKKALHASDAGTRQDPTNMGSTLSAVFPEKRLETGAGTLSYRECGQGSETIVLLHGISSGAASWEQCAQVLQSQARVVAWNAPGYGASSALASKTPTALQYAQQLAALLQGLDITQCVLVGHSLGALMAAAYSSLPQPRARALVLLSPALGYGSADKQHLADKVRASRFEALQFKGLEKMALDLPGRLLTQSATDEQRCRVTENARLLNENGYRQAVEMLCADDINRYPLIAGHSQVFCGEYDVVTTAEQSGAYAARHQLPFGLIKNAGHACYVEQADQVAEKIKSVLHRAHKQA